MRKADWLNFTFSVMTLIKYEKIYVTDIQVATRNDVNDNLAGGNNNLTLFKFITPFVAFPIVNVHITRIQPHLKRHTFL